MAARSRNSGTPSQRRLQGRTNYLAGLAAEESVARHYERAGLPIAHRRWRGHAGEIDLVAQDGDGLVFIEVKSGKCLDRALSRVTPGQVARIMSTAEEYLATQPKGSLTDVRFDVAIVDGHGQPSVLENAFL